jgi:heme o synthase
MNQPAVVTPAPPRSTTLREHRTRSAFSTDIGRRIRTFAKLARVRVLGLVIFSMIMASWIAGEAMPQWSALGHLVLGTGLVTFGAIILNQRLEVRRDAVMARTADRPLPMGQMALAQGTWLGTAITILGAAYLAVFLNLTFVLLAGLAWFLYAIVYTLMKPLTAWQTPVGAITGAMPMLLGAAMADAELNAMGWILFGIVYLWQFPHAMAIAWLYRRQYKAAGIQVSSVVDPSGRSAGWMAILGAISLILVSVMPCVMELRGWSYGFAALLLGLIYLVSSLRFFRSRDDQSARALFRFSLAYLPLVLLALFVATIQLR